MANLLTKHIPRGPRTSIQIGGKVFFLQAALVITALAWHSALAEAPLPTTTSRMFEATFESRKSYNDPFNDVDVDVIFSRGRETWRVPTFWRGGNRWTVRFAPPAPGEYSYCIESTDKTNPDLNGSKGRVKITAYTGGNDLLRHGMLRVSSNKHNFEFADGTPFYWLGDTWWDGLSGRLSWEGFQTLAADRKAKGFTVVQMCAGLIPSDEETAPIDPGFRNEGGAVWDPEFRQINPRYFDAADRRIEYLLKSGITPALVGGWFQAIRQMGVDKMKKHWRYVIARYGAYPAFWIIGGEIFDPPGDENEKLRTRTYDGNPSKEPISPGWTDVARYVRKIDPFHHPVSVHDIDYGMPPIQDPSLMDFDLLQCGHDGWPVIGIEVAQINAPYGTAPTDKPVVIGEIDYERLGEKNFEDLQRVAFWLGMLNGAAGYTYGANGVWESYSQEEPFQRLKWSLYTWRDGINFPGSHQIGLGAKLLRSYPWWNFRPHQEWVTPRGTTLKAHGPDILADWKAQNGDFLKPYAAGIPSEVRFIYIPYFGFLSTFSAPPTILRLEQGVLYHAFFWEPTLGIRIDLGTIECPSPGKLVHQSPFGEGSSANWTDVGSNPIRGGGILESNGRLLTITKDATERDLVAAVDADGNANAALILRFQDPNNFLAAVYSPKEKALYLYDRRGGTDGEPLGRTTVPALGSKVRLRAECREGWFAASISDGAEAYSTPIVDVTNSSKGGVGLMHLDDGSTQRFSKFELRQSPTLVEDEHHNRKLYDAENGYRGEMSGPPGIDIGWGSGIVGGWADFGMEKIVLLDEYRPKRLPYGRDWLLVLEHLK